MQNSIFDPEKLKIVEFKIISGNIKAPYEFDSNLIENYETDMDFSSSINIERQIVKANMGFDIKTKSSSNQEETKVHFNFIYLFEVSNLEEIFSLEEGFDIKKLMIAIAAISFSTSRGVLLTRLQGTVMKEYILPIINPSKLLDEWIDKEVEKPKPKKKTTTKKKAVKKKTEKKK